MRACSSLSQADHGGQVFQIDWNAPRNLSNAAVAWRAHNFSDSLTARNRPGKRMFAAPGTKDEDFHESTPSKRALPLPKR